jgi:hypothetical protein
MHDSRPARFISLVTGAALITFIVWFPMREYQNLLTKQFSNGVCGVYNALARPLFVTSLALVLAGAMTGKHRLFRFLCAGSFWGPWAKLTFMTYLIHMLVFWFFYAQIKMSSYLNHKDILWTYLACLLISYLVAVPCSLIFEAPYLHIEKFFIFAQKTEKV